MSGCRSDCGRGSGPKVVRGRGNLRAGRHPRRSGRRRRRLLFGRFPLRAVAEIVTLVDHDVADIDPMQRATAGFALGHLALELDGAARRIDYARKFNQHAVAGRLDDGATATAVRERDPAG
jgi:hypothetical protein